MTAEEFVSKWSAILANPLQGAAERALAQQHFLDLCEVLGHPKPSDESFRFEKPAAKIAGDRGFADVWKRGCFAWEYKRPGGDLTAAYQQIKSYADGLENPPLLIVSDFRLIRIHTNFTASVKREHDIVLERLNEPAMLGVLRSAFFDPEALRPDATRAAITAKAAEKFAELSELLKERYPDPQVRAHFLIRVVFCLFAEDVGILPESVFTKLLEYSRYQSNRFAPACQELFDKMATGGRMGWVNIAHFDGGLFDGGEALAVRMPELMILREAAALDWSSIEPAIFGTLFERFIDPAKRTQLGAHYTDPATILRLVHPVVLEPLEREWADCRERIAQSLARPGAAGLKKAKQEYESFLDRLHRFRVLDPACGSGNFLYLSLKTLKDFERRVRVEVQDLGMEPGFAFATGPANLRGIELNPFAAELARVSIWIGEIQWMMENGYGHPPEPILGKLDEVETRDAILAPGGGEPEWPEADAIVGNPPFLGGKFMRANLGDAYVEDLFRLYEGRVAAEADLVIYWFEKARAQIEAGRARSAGLVATNSIRGGANRKTLERIRESIGIFEAWGDEDWVNEGAAVRVSLVCFGQPPQAVVRLDGRQVPEIFADLTGTGVDLTQARRLKENLGISFMGDTKGGAFDIPGELAREWLAVGGNPNGRPNSDVLRPWINGMDVARRPRGMWIVDFGTEMSEAECAGYEAPFEYVLKHVKPERDKNRRESYRTYWWRHVEPRQGMWKALEGKPRYIVTPRVAKHRLFVRQPAVTVPDSQLIVITRDDDAFFGVLHSRFHEIWALRLGTSLEDRPRYTPTTTFETFPFPEGLISSGAGNTALDEVAAAARRLDSLRELWLNPPEWTGKIGHERELSRRTLTNLYNAKPAWLVHAHEELDQAVAEAYGWAGYTASMPEDEILRRLLDLNMARPAYGS